MEKIERKVLESSPDESRVMKLYMDLRTEAFNAHANKEESSDTAQKFVDVVRLLNGGVGLEPSFCEEMLRQIHDLERQYLAFQRAIQLGKCLERESRGDVWVPHLYEAVVASTREALAIGVPESALVSLRKIIDEYHARIRGLARDRR